MFGFLTEPSTRRGEAHRENDPSPGSPGGFSANDPSGPSRVDVKLSFANPLDEANEIKAPPPFGYVPEIAFRNQSWMDHLTGSRFPALAGWQKSNNEVFDLMNRVVSDILSRFNVGGSPAAPHGAFNRDGRGFGWGTVHHAAGSLRMPYRPRLDADFDVQSVVDEDLRVAGHDNLYVCDMSVMPLSSAANPVRTLAALALRLSRRLG